MMSKSKMVREAQEYNRCAIIARRMGDLPATVSAFCERRDYLIKLARRSA
jgi:hypothetical protein